MAVTEEVLLFNIHRKKLHEYKKRLKTIAGSIPEESAPEVYQ